MRAILQGRMHGRKILVRRRAGDRDASAVIRYLLEASVIREIVPCTLISESTEKCVREQTSRVKFNGNCNTIYSI